MQFVDELAGLESVSVVGMAKNTGKTETLNYIIGQLSGRSEGIALTSIGIDGEQTDQVTRTEKPEITVPAGMSFVTSEKHFHLRRLTADIFALSREHTSLGRLVAARTLIPGKVLLSGPASTGGLRRLLAAMRSHGMKLTIVDGALSRLSLASPTVTQGLVLATGAAVSTSIPELVKRTKYLYSLITLPEVEPALQQQLQEIEQGVWAIDSEGQLHDLQLPSVFLMAKQGKDLFRYGHRLYVAGAVTDRVVEAMRMQGEPTELIVQDFTRVFVTAPAMAAYVGTGGSVRCAMRNRLLALTVNPQAPNGYRLDSAKLRAAMHEALGIPVYDVRAL